MTLSLADGLFWASVACCLVAQLLIVRSVLATRAASPAGLPRSRAAVELFWAVLPAVALAVLLVFTWRAVRAHASASTPSSPTTITVPA